MLRELLFTVDFFDDWKRWERGPIHDDHNEAEDTNGSSNLHDFVLNLKHTSNNNDQKH